MFEWLVDRQKYKSESVGGKKAGWKAKTMKRKERHVREKGKDGWEKRQAKSNDRVILDNMKFNGLMVSLHSLCNWSRYSAKASRVCFCWTCGCNTEIVGHTSWKCGSQANQTT